MPHQRDILLSNQAVWLLLLLAIFLFRFGPVISAFVIGVLETYRWRWKMFVFLHGVRNRETAAISKHTSHQTRRLTLVGTRRDDLPPAHSS